MNPNRDEEETNGTDWQDEVAWARAKELARLKTKVQAQARRKKKKLKIAEAPALSRAQICHILDHYDFDALHDRIMKAVDKFKN